MLTKTINALNQTQYDSISCLFLFFLFFSGGGQPRPFFPFWRFVCGPGFALRLRRLRKLGRPGISEGPEKDREGGPDEKSAVRIPPTAIARKCIKCKVHRLFVQYVLTYAYHCMSVSSVCVCKKIEEIQNIQNIQNIQP